MIAFASVVGIQTTTYALLGKQMMGEPLAALLPEPSECPSVCCSEWLKRGIPRSAESDFARVLESRYEAVYVAKDEIPYTAWDLECRFDVCREVEIRGVCIIDWDITKSGPFWFSATYSSWHGPGARAGVNVTYAWCLFKWVEISSTPRLWAS